MMDWIALAMLAVGAAFVWWLQRPPRCEECHRVLGPPRPDELESGNPIGCRRCNLNLRARPFGYFDENWEPCDPPPVVEGK